MNCFAALSQLISSKNTFSLDKNWIHATSPFKTITGDKYKAGLPVEQCSQIDSETLLGLIQMFLCQVSVVEEP